MTPRFSPAGYDQMLQRLTGLGYQLQPIEHAATGRTVFLRHDLDLTIDGIDEIARIEHKRFARSTWMVRPDAHYNPAYPPNRDLLRRLYDQGHRIGLHYDLTNYPPDEADQQIHTDIILLETAIGRPITSMVMHRPHTGKPDTARRIPYVHHAHHDPDLAYVSDSARRWRTDVPVTIDQLLDGDGPDQVQLLTHPEHWLGPEDTTLDEHYALHAIPHAIRQHQAAAAEEWHAAAQRHQVAA